MQTFPFLTCSVLLCAPAPGCICQTWALPSQTHSHGWSVLLEGGRLIFRFRFYSPKPYFFPMCSGRCVSTKLRLALLFGEDLGVILLQIMTHIWGLTMLFNCFYSYQGVTPSFSSVLFPDIPILYFESEMCLSAKVSSGCQLKNWLKHLSKLLNQKTICSSLLTLVTRHDANQLI